MPANERKPRPAIATKKEATRRSPTVKSASAGQPAAKKPTARKSAAKQTAGKKTAARKSAAKQTASKKPAARKPAVKQTAGKKPAARKPAAKQTALSTSLHRHLVMSLRHSEPFGAALTRKLEALRPYEDPEEREAAALALVDAVSLPPELLARVTELVPASLEDINLLWPDWDGESDPFPLASL